MDQNTNYDQFSPVPNGFSLYKCKFNYSKIKALQNCSYFLSVLSVAWNSTKLTLFLKVKLTKTHIEPNFNCKRLQKWQQTWWSFFGLYKNNWNSQIHPGNTKVRTICLHLWHASVVACHVILYHSGWLTNQNVNLPRYHAKNTNRCSGPELDGIITGWGYWQISNGKIRSSLFHSNHYFINHS